MLVGSDPPGVSEVHNIPLQSSSIISIDGFTYSFFTSVAILTFIVVDLFVCNYSAFGIASSFYS